MSEVVQLWRYPVKSTQGERLDEALIGPRGVVGAGTAGGWDPCRFRANVVIGETGEDDWVGAVLQAGTAVDVLRTIIRERENNLGIGTLVRTPGVVGVGDAAAPLA